MVSPQKVLVFGDSHTHAVSTAIRKLKNHTAGCEIEAYRLTKVKNGTMIGDIDVNDLIARCKTLTPTDLLVSVVGGNQHSSFSLIQHEIPFRLYDQPGGNAEQADAIGDGDVLIPRNVIKDHFRRGMRNGDARRIFEMANVGSQRTVHLAPPPPKADEAHILNRIETSFADKIAAGFGVSSAPLRLAIWQLQNEVFSEILAEEGVELLPPPPGTQTVEGYLHPDYYGPDATHANAAYGAKILEQIREFLAVSAQS